MIPALTQELRRRGLPEYGPVATRAEFLMGPGMNFPPTEAVDRAITYCSDSTPASATGGW